MELGKILEFRRDLYFEGAVQADWFYSQEKAAKVAENFVFHGSVPLSGSVGILPAQYEIYMKFQKKFFEILFCSRPCYLPGESGPEPAGQLSLAAYQQNFQTIQPNYQRTIFSYSWTLPPSKILNPGILKDGMVVYP